jgi:hypothetical protein
MKDKMAFDEGNVSFMGTTKDKNGSNKRQNVRHTDDEGQNQSQ